jgi:hypothetical protein
MSPSYVKVALERYGPAPWMCSYCNSLIKQLGLKSDEGHVHHVDGDHSNEDPNNLIIIHSACHTRLHRIDRKHTQETREKIASAHKGRPKLPEHIAAIKASHVGMLGKTQTQDTRNKISIAHKNLLEVPCPCCDRRMKPGPLGIHIKHKHPEHWARSTT